MAYVLGIDIGTYETKGVLVDRQGTIRAQAARAHKMLVPQPGWAEHRAEGEEPDASQLAGGLMRYSERGQDYIDELRAMIRQNDEVIKEAQERRANK